MGSRALFEDREENWQLPPQEGSVGDRWEVEKMRRKRRRRTCIACSPSSKMFALNPCQAKNIFAGVSGDIWSSVIFSVIVTSRHAKCFVSRLIGKGTLSDLYASSFFRSFLRVETSPCQNFDLELSQEINP